MFFKVFGIQAFRYQGCLGALFGAILAQFAPLWTLKWGPSLVHTLLFLFNPFFGPALGGLGSATRTADPENPGGETGTSRGLSLKGSLGEASRAR